MRTLEKSLAPLLAQNHLVQRELAGTADLVADDGPSKSRMLADAATERAKAQNTATNNIHNEFYGLNVEPEDTSLTGGQNSGYGEVDGGTEFRGDPLVSPSNNVTGTTLLALMDKKEGGGKYNTLFGHSQNRNGQFAGIDVTKMSIADVVQFSRPDGAYGQWVKTKVGRVATPMGRFQIVGTTLRGAIKELGIPADAKFTPQVQNRIFKHLANRRLKSAKTPAGKRAAMRAEWEGFHSVADNVLDKAIRNFERA